MAELALRHHALALAEGAGQRAAAKRTSTPSRFTLPATTMPPMRKVRPEGASLAATCEGVKKNTRFFWNAVSTKALATPSATRPSAIAAMRLCLGFMASFYLPGRPGAPRTAKKKDHFERQGHEGHGVGTPEEEAVAHSRSRIMQRTRTSTAAIE
jgi:hypothetical protein